MRTFKLGGVDDRRFVVIERDGNQVKVIKGNADGSTRQSIKTFADEAEARVAGEQMARELESRGYRERNSKDPGRAATSATPKPAKVGAAASRPRPAAPRDDSDGLDLGLLAEADDGSSSEAAALLPRIAPPPGADPAAKPKAKVAKKKKKKKKGGAPGQGGDLDKRMIALFCAAGLACLGAVAFLGYKAFLAPASIVGNWTGGRTEHEIGKYLTHVDYHLILDANRKASMAVGEGPPSVGTYTYKTGRLRLDFKDEEGDDRTVEYRTKLGSATLDLYDVGSGQKVVQLMRSFENKAVGDAGGKAGGGGPAQPAPADLAAAPADKGADEKLASVAFAAKDTAFALRHPPGWEAETGARGDNSYSWIRLTKGSTRIRVFADAAGSLLAGPNSGNEESGSELAPVHSAHLRYKKDAEELYSKYEESPPATFPASGLGEGRIATFNATGDGLFGAKLKGIRVTFLTNDRRVSILCEAPAASFDKTLPTFLAVCRSLSR